MASPKQVEDETVDLSKSGEAVIEDGWIVVRVAIETLPQAIETACGMHYIAGHWKVTDAAAFAEEITRALNDEQEDGTTPIHRLLDQAAEHAIEQGGEGVEADEEQRHTHG